MLRQGRDALVESSSYLNTPKGRHLSRLFGVFLYQSKQVISPKSTLSYKVAILVVATLFVPFSVLLGVISRPTPAHAATSSSLNFQGRLLSNTGALVADGTYNMQFNLYTVASGGSTQWTESYLVNATQGVTIKSGYFSVNLGSITSFPSTINWDQEQWLGMTVRGTNSCTPFGSCASPADSEMTPRFKLTAVPYAFQAANALGVASNPTSTASTNSNAVAITTGNASGSTSNSGSLSLNVGTATGTRGAITIGTTNAPSSLTVGNTGTPFTLQGNASSVITATNSTFTTTLGFTTPTANQTYNLPNSAAGTYSICTTANNCTGLGAYIQNGTAAQNSANYNIQSAATGSVTAKFRLIGSQTADVLQVRDSTDTTTLFSVSKDGNILSTGQTTLGSATNQIQLLVKANASQSAANPLVMFKDSTGATELARINVDAVNNYAFGSGTLGSVSSGSSNIGIGGGTLGAVTTNSQNIAIGNTSQKFGTGSNNVSLGTNTLASATFSGGNNTAVGDLALQANTNAAENTAVGRAALGATTTGGQNVGVGNAALNANLGGAQNTAVGNSAALLSTGSNNIFLGYNAGSNLTAGNSNILIGSGVTAVNTTGSSQLNIGDALYGDLANDRIAIGNTTTSAGRLTVNNAATTDAIFVAQDNGSAVLTVADGGAVTATSTIRSNSGFNYNGTAGASTTCSGGQVLQNQAVQGGIVTGGSCTGVMVSTLTDNIADALDLQEATNNYININTTNGSENISLGNATTNPTFTFLGTGTLTVTGATAFNGNLTVGDASTDTATFNANILANNALTGSSINTSGTGGSNVTSITLASSGFANGDIILVDNTGGSGQDYYTRITSGGGTTTLTVSPAISYGTAAGYTGNAVITKYNVQNIGAANSGTTFANANRFFQGYFLGGVVTGAGSTTLSDQNLTSTGALYLNTGGANTRLTVDSTGNVGIGTAAPSQKLNVHESTASTNVYLKLSTVGTGNTSTDGLDLAVDGTTGTAYLINRENTSLIVRTNNLDRLTISAAGDTTLSGNLTVSGTGTSSFAGNILSIGTADTGPGDRVINLYGGGTGTAEGGQLSLYTSADYDTTIDSYNLDVFQDAFRLHSGGSVRLQVSAAGDTTLGGNLTVSGTGTSTITGNLTVGTGTYNTIIKHTGAGGNTHIDSTGGNGYIYLNYYTGGNRINFCDGAAHCSYMTMATTAQGKWFSPNGAAALYVDNNGNAGATIATGVSANHLCFGAAGEFGSCTSTRTQKHDIVSTTYGLAELRQLRPVQFAWNADNRQDVGFIAEEASQIIPETTQWTTSGTVKSFDNAPIVSVLTRSVQQLDSQVQNIQTQLDLLVSGYMTTLHVTGSAQIDGSLKVLGDTEVQKLTVNGKIITSGTAPTIAAGVSAGTGLTLNATVAGNDTAGTISIRTGSSGLTANNILADVTFSSAYDQAPIVTVSPTTEDAASIRFYLIKTATGWSIKALDAPQANRLYSFDYHVIQ